MCPPVPNTPPRLCVLQALQSMNAVRAEHRAPALAWSPALAEVAGKRVGDMARACGATASASPPSPALLEDRARLGQVGGCARADACLRVCESVPLARL